MDSTNPRRKNKEPGPHPLAVPITGLGAVSELAPKFDKYRMSGHDNNYDLIAGKEVPGDPPLCHCKSGNPPNSRSHHVNSASEIRIALWTVWDQR